MQGIVDALGVSHGYDIYKVYKDAFEPVDLRSIYYHLAKGTLLKEFKGVGVEKVKGNYTWGKESTRKCYILGPNATQKATDELHIIVKTLGLKYKPPGKVRVKK
jgi:hypothetical protein